MEVSNADDVALFDELSAQHRGAVFSYLLGRTGCRSTAVDLLQETFLRLLLESQSGRCPQEMRAWLYRVAHNALVSDARKRSSAARATERLWALPHDEPDPEDEVLRRDEMARVGTALAALHPAGRQAIGMAAAGYRSHEIATTLGRSDLAGRALLHRSRLRIREAVAEPA